MGIFVLLSLSTYLRPSQLLTVVTDGLIPPNQSISAYWTLLVHPEEGLSRSKTGEADVSFLLDSAYLSYLEPIYHILKQKGKGRPLFEFTYGEYALMFQKVSKMLGVKVTSYQTRHSGASIDRASGARSRPDVQGRGQWKQEKSVVRYDKHARLAQSFERHPRQLQEYLSACEQQAVDIVVCGKLVTPPPWVVTRL